MKVNDLIQGLVQEKEDEKPGTYAGVKFSDDTIAALEKYTKDNKIPNALPADKYHTTLLYSRKHLPNYKPEGDYKTPMTGSPTGFEIWPNYDSSKNCLVLSYSCPQLYQRHHKLMNQHGATYDFDEYKPHVTLSYDVGNLKVDKLPTFEDSLEITSEYDEELKIGWADD